MRVHIFLEYLRREWPGVVTWVLAICLGIEGLKEFDPRSTIEFLTAGLAVSVFVLVVAALGLELRRTAERWRSRDGGR